MAECVRLAQCVEKDGDEASGLAQEPERDIVALTCVEHAVEMLYGLLRIIMLLGKKGERRRSC